MLLNHKVIITIIINKTMAEMANYVAVTSWFGVKDLRIHTVTTSESENAVVKYFRGYIKNKAVTVDGEVGLMLVSMNPKKESWRLVRVLQEGNAVTSIYEITGGEMTALDVELSQKQIDYEQVQPSSGTFFFKKNLK